MVIRTAILVDGGYYRKKAKKLFGDKSPEDRAKELEHYCLLHLNHHKSESYLYRIFYYDCPPSDKNVFHPLTQKSVNLKKSPLYSWSNEFLQNLKSKRKFAVRLGRLSDNELQYTLSPDVIKDIFTGKRNVSDITEANFTLTMKQKSVDMKLGIDIATMTLKKQVDQIILIAGDSDFVPAAKLARREGIDFILDPMDAKINDDLMEHVDGIRTKYKIIIDEQTKKASGNSQKSKKFPLLGEANCNM